MKKINCIFEGGGIKGIAFVGAIKYLEENSYIINKVGGTSVGSLISALIAAGYNSNEMKDILYNYDFNKLNSSNKINKIPILGKTINLFSNKGFYSTKELERFVDELLEIKGINTFKDLNIELKIIAADITKKKIIIFPDSLYKYNIKSDNFKISTAVSMSSTIPIHFQPKKLGNSVVVDGGVIASYPMWLFNKDHVDTIGFIIRDDNQNSPNKSFVKYLTSVIGTMISRDDEIVELSNYKTNTVSITIDDIDSTDFNISKENKEKLFNLGYQTCKSFFENKSIK